MADTRTGQLGRITMKLKTFCGALALTALSAGHAAAGDCGYQYCWGAVGFGPNGAYG